MPEEKLTFISDFRVRNTQRRHPESTIGSGLLPGYTDKVVLVFVSFVLIYLMFAVGACMGGESGGPPSAVKVTDGVQSVDVSSAAGKNWVSIEGMPESWLEGLWGSSETDIFTVGDKGTILHYDGSDWTPMNSGTSRYLSDVWGSSGSDVYAVGDAGTILHYDGKGWSPMSGQTDRWLFGIWGSSGSDVFAVGENGTILHYDGGNWKPMKSGTNELLLSVWGSSASDVYAVGSNGTILHYDGRRWRALDREVAEWLFAVWGSSAKDVFAVGWAGKILHYDGSRWQVMSNGVSNDLSGVWGSSDTDVYAVGVKGTILHYDGTNWTPVSIGSSSDLNSVWGSSASDVYAVGDGGTIFHSVPPSPGQLEFDNSSYRTNEGSRIHTVRVIRTGGSSGTVTVDYFTSDGTAAEGSDYKGASGTLTFGDGETEQFIEISILDDTLTEMSETVMLTLAHPAGGATLGPQSSSVLSIVDNDGTDWSDVNSGVSQVLNRVWGMSETEVFAVGDSGTVLLYNGSTWAPMDSNSTAGLRGVWGSSGTNVFAVGERGAILRYDGGNWSSMDTETTDGLHGVWGSSGTDVFAVGDNGTILHYDGSGWALMSRDETKGLRGVWGSSGTDVFAVGDNGTILHYDGSRWTSTGTGIDYGLQGIWGSSGTDVFAVGDNGTILHYDGSNWTLMSSGTNRPLRNVWGSSGTNVFAVGDNGTILHYGGDRWTPMGSGTEEKLTGVWTDSETNAFAVGEAGTILRYKGTTNTAPIADAGPSQTITDEKKVTLDGSNSSDPDDGIVSYRWSQKWGPEVTLSDPNSATPSFNVPKVEADGVSMIFLLTVTDKGNLEDTDTTIVNVTSDNLPPVANAGPDQTIMEGMPVTLNASDSTDPDDGIASYEWVQIKGTPEVVLSDPMALKPTFTAPHVKPGSASLTFQLTVTDSKGLEDTDTTIVNVMSINLPPMADAGPDRTVEEETKVTLDASNSLDQDNGIVAYVWKQQHGPPVILSNPRGTQCVFTAPQVGPEGARLVFRLTVTDLEGLAHSDTVTIHVRGQNDALDRNP